MGRPRRAALWRVLLAARARRPRRAPVRPVRHHDAGGPVLRLADFTVAGAERALIGQALARTDGNRTRAARLLGMSVRALRMKLNGRSHVR